MGTLQNCGEDLLKLNKLVFLLRNLKLNRKHIAFLVVIVFFCVYLK